MSEQQQQQRQHQQQHHHHHQSGKPVHEERVTAKYPQSEYLCRLNFFNKLPPMPCESKFLKLPFNPSDYDRYQLTSLELKRKYEPVVPTRIAVFARDFIDPATYTTAAATSTGDAKSPSQAQSEPRFLPIEDFELLEDTDPYKLEYDAYLAAAATTTTTTTSTSTSSSTTTTAAASGDKRKRKSTAGGGGGGKDNSEGPKEKRARVEARPDTLEGQREIIERSFEDAKKAISKHPSDSTLRPVEVLPVFPSFELYGAENIYVRMMGNPLYDRETNKAEDKKALGAMSPATRSVIRGVTDCRRGGVNGNFAQMLYPDARATAEAVKEGALRQGEEEVYTYSGYFEMPANTPDKAPVGSLDRRCLGLVISENSHKNDSVPGANFVAEYVRFKSLFQMQRAADVEPDDKNPYVRVSTRKMTRDEEDEFERRAAALSKPDRGGPGETELGPGNGGGGGDDDDDEAEDEYGDVNEAAATATTVATATATTPSDSD